MKRALSYLNPGKTVTFGGKVRKVVSVNMGGKVQLKGLKFSVDIADIFIPFEDEGIEDAVRQELGSCEDGLYLQGNLVWVKSPDDKSLSFVGMLDGERIVFKG